MILVGANRKGGSSKTTTMVNLWAGLPSRSLLIDLDSQMNATTVTGADEEASKSIYDVLEGKCSAQDAIQHLEKGDVISSSIALDTIASLPMTTLKKALDPISGAYDYILLDTPPALSAITVNALACADHLIVPVVAESLSLKGLMQLLEIVNVVRKEANPKLNFAGVLITRWIRSNLQKQMRGLFDEVAQNAGGRVFSTNIRQSVVVMESQAMREDLFTYNTKSNLTKDYTAFIKELLEVISNG